jgi:hypothetical protein
LKVNKVYIHDGTTIKCGSEKIDLSFLKLLEKKNTFYMKFGFDFEITDNINLEFKYSTKEDLKKEIDKFKQGKLFYKILIKLFNDDCASYYKLYKNIIINNKYKIIYGKKIINRQYKNDFIFLLKLRSLYIFSYTFLNN